MAKKIKNVASLFKSFPSMPGAAVKLLALIDDPDVSVSQIEAILRHDAGLTANIIKLANAAYFGIPSKRSMIAKKIRENLAVSNIFRAIVPVHEGANHGNRASQKGGSA